MSLGIDYSKLNRLVGMFLAHKVIANQRTEGIACAGDILLYCRDEGIVIPSNRPVLWVNLKVADMIKNGAKGFHIEERPGFGTGINFRWRLNEEDIS